MKISLIKKKIFFEKHSVNLARIPQSTGFPVDTWGIVLKFNRVEGSNIWYDPDSTGYVSSANMDKNITFSKYRILQ